MSAKKFKYSGDSYRTFENRKQFKTEHFEGGISNGQHIDTELSPTIQNQDRIG